MGGRSTPTSVSSCSHGFRKWLEIHADRSHNLRMHNIIKIALLVGLVGLYGCGGGASDEPGEDPSASGTDSPDVDAGEETAKAEGDWSVGDTIPSGMEGVADIQVLEVHKNGQGPVCGSGKSATLAYKAMLADGTVIDPGTRPFTFTVGPGNAIKGWHVIVAKMRVGDSFTVTVPQQLAYGPSKGDLKFDMELLKFE